MEHAMSVPFGTPSATAQKNRAVSVLIVGAVHVVIIYGFLGLTGYLPLPITPPDIGVTVIDPGPPPPTTQVEPDVKVDLQSRVTGPTAVEPTINIAQDSGAIKGVVLVDPGKITNLGVTGPQIIAATRTIPPYPLTDVRLGHEGTVTLKLTIDGDGIVTNAVVMRSSGSDTLDAAAVSWVKARWRYKPAMENGSSVPSTSMAAVKFELRNR